MKTPSTVYHTPLTSSNLNAILNSLLFTQSFEKYLGLPGLGKLVKPDVEQRSNSTAGLMP